MDRPQLTMWANGREQRTQGVLHTTALSDPRRYPWPMSSFIVNKNPQPISGDHEVHDLSALCNHLPEKENQIDLGKFPDCHGAVAEAKRRFPKHAHLIDGCFFCAKECHKR